MSDERPLSVRCAEALGFDTSAALHKWDEAAEGYRQCRRCSAMAHWGGPEPEICCPPFGEDSPGGWACTGPLLKRFGLGLSMPRALVFATGPYGRDAYAPNACAAIAEWVAEHGRKEASRA